MSYKAPLPKDLFEQIKLIAAQAASETDPEKKEALDALTAHRLQLAGEEFDPPVHQMGPSDSQFLTGLGRAADYVPGWLRTAIEAPVVAGVEKLQGKPTHLGQDFMDALTAKAPTSDTQLERMGVGEGPKPSDIVEGSMLPMSKVAAAEMRGRWFDAPLRTGIGMTADTALSPGLLARALGTKALKPTLLKELQEASQHLTPSEFREFMTERLAQQSRSAAVPVRERLGNLLHWMDPMSATAKGSEKLYRSAFKDADQAVSGRLAIKPSDVALENGVYGNAGSVAKSLNTIADQEGEAQRRAVERVSGQPGTEIRMKDALGGAHDEALKAFIYGGPQAESASEQAQRLAEFRRNNPRVTTQEAEDIRKVLQEERKSRRPFHGKDSNVDIKDRTASKVLDKATLGLQDEVANSILRSGADSRTANDYILSGKRAEAAITGSQAMSEDAARGFKPSQSPVRTAMGLVPGGGLGLMMGLADGNMAAIVPTVAAMGAGTLATGTTTGATTLGLLGRKLANPGAQGLLNVIRAEEVQRRQPEYQEYKTPYYLLRKQYGVDE